MSNTYPVDGKLAGVVAYSPFWVSPALFGAVIGLRLPLAAASPLWYFYSRAELTDGPGHG